MRYDDLSVTDAGFLGLKSMQILGSKSFWYRYISFFFYFFFFTMFTQIGYQTLNNKLYRLTLTLNIYISVIGRYHWKILSDRYIGQAGAHQRHRDRIITLIFSPHLHS